MKVSQVKNSYNSKKAVNQNTSKSKFVSFGAEPDKVQISTKKNGSKKNLGFILGGVVALATAAAGIIYAIKKHKAKNIIKTASGLNHKAIPEINPKVEFPAWQISEEEKLKMTVSPLGDKRIRVIIDNGFIESNETSEVVEKILDSVSSSSMRIDMKVAREVLPVLIKNDIGLQIGGQYERFLSSINEENKDFAMSKVVPWLVENYKKMGLSDSHNNNVFMAGVSPKNMQVVEKLSKVSKDLGLDHTANFFAVVHHTYKKNESFVFDNMIPTIIKNRDSMLKPDGQSTQKLIEILTPDNIKRVFEEDLKMILENKEKLAIENGDDVVAALLKINTKGKDSVFN